MKKIEMQPKLKQHCAELVAENQTLTQQLIALQRELTEQQQVQERLRTMAQTVPSIIWSATPEGTITFHNKQWLTYTGLTPEQNQHNWPELVLHPDDYERCMTTWRHALATGEDYVIEVRNRRYDGVYRWFITRAVPQRDSAGRIIAWFGSTTDIDDQKQLEERLRASEVQSRDLIFALPVALYMTDREGRITLFNERAAEMWGTRPEIGKDKWCGSWRIYRPNGELLPHEECPMAVSLREGRSIRGEEIVVERPDGTRAAVLPHPEPLRNASGQIVGAINMLVDITERKQMEEARAKLAAIIESSDDAIISKDLNGNIKSWNQGAERIFGYTAQEAIGQPILMLIPPDRHDEEVDILARIRRGEFVQHYETLRRRKDGTLLNISLTISPIIDARGQIVGASKIARNITERKQSEALREELLHREQQARATAEAANRAKDEFLAVVSHELRAPLNAMLGWAKILKSGKYKPETLTHAVEVIERSARSQQQLIEDLLDSARIISGKLRLETQPVNMTMVIEAALDIMRPAAEAKGIRLETLYLTESDVITGDPERLQQVVWNLLSNAVKFTPGGGHITVKLERVDPHLQLTVTDTGKGISRDFLPYVFDRFHQADSSSTRRHGGLGLGLALVRHLIELHGGIVSADSPGEGKGTSFIIHLPLRAVRAATSEIEPTEASRNVGFNMPPALEGLHILVVDDEADARELLTLMLEQQGAQVVAAASAREALAVLKQDNSRQADVIVSDIGMPDENGYALMREVRTLPRERGAQIPAVALTAYGRASDRIAALSAGFQMHVPKPVEPTELIMVIAGLTGRVGKGMNA